MVTSRRIFNTVRDYTADVEPYSIDKAFIALDRFSDVISHYQHIRAVVKRDTGIPVSIGIASTRTLAKVTNHISKKQTAYCGVCYLANDSGLLTEALK